MALPRHIFHHTPEMLRAWCDERSMPGFRAEQILDWVYRKGVVDPALMLNLSQRDRATLATEMTFLSGETVADRVASDGTRKLLIEWSRDEATARRSDEGGDRHEGTEARRHAGDGSVLHVLGGGRGDPSRQTECVMIPSLASTHPDPEPSGRRASRLPTARRTACISSQIGCPVGCRFCASGLGGLDGNLTAGRIVEQVWRLSHLAAPVQSEPDAAVPSSPRASVPSQTRITNVVFMGMGEPLANFANVKHAVETLAAPWGMGISARKITISTVGLPQAIRKLAEQLDLPVTLALSLHAPNDELRRKLIPWSEYTTVAELIDACGAWFDKTGREITLEYILLGGVNDRPEHAEELATVAKRLRSNVNLIRYNEVRGIPFDRPATDDVRRFQDILRARGVNTHIRASRGRDIEAACGQLRHEKAGAT